MMRPLLLANAAQTELEGQLKLFEASVLRDDQAEQTAVRAKCHDLLESILDLKSESMVKVRKAY
jgi:hypothetical protein